MRYFDTRFLEEADEFMAALKPKTVKKILYNIAVGTHAIRAGTVPGTHRVILSGDGETLELVHTVTDRSVFARGALRAARFVHGRAPGLYTVDDLIHDSRNP